MKGVSAVLGAAYLKLVRLSVEQRRLNRVIAAEQRQDARRAAIRAWWTSLPPAERRDRYKAAEISLKLAIPTNELGALLLDLRWRRIRSWRPDEPFARYWKPPPDT